MATDATPPTRDQTAEIGQLLGDRYRILEFIGDGGMGSVFRANDSKTGEEIAIKLLHRDTRSLDTVAARFRREGVVGKKLDHDGCVKVLESGTLDNGDLFLTMELAIGRTLGDLLDDHSALEIPRALHIASHVARGLEHAHAHGVIHRDIKPDNIILVDKHGDRDFAKILDFGIAKFRGEKSAGFDDAQLTQVGTTVGTPRYMPPEQAFGKDVDTRADLYSLTAVLYLMLTGSAPFENDDVLQLLMEHASKPIPPLQDALAAAADLPALSRLIDVGLAKKPGDRFESASAYLEAINEALDEFHLRQHLPAQTSRDPTEQPSSLLERGDTEIRPARRWKPPAPRTLIILGAVSALLIGTLDVLLGSGDDEPPPSPPTLGSTLQGVATQMDQLTSPPRPPLADRARRLNDSRKYRKVLDITGKRSNGWVRAERGHAQFALEHPIAALREFGHALEEVPALRNDKRILDTARRLIGSPNKTVDLNATFLLVRFTDDPTARIRLATLASSGKVPSIRARARKMVKAIQIEDDVDYVQSYILDLRQEGTCKRRRNALLALEEIGDKSALPQIRKARRRMRGGILGIGSKNVNACMRKDIPRVLSKLENK